MSGRAARRRWRRWSFRLAALLCAGLTVELVCGRLLERRLERTPRALAHLHWQAFSGVGDVTQEQRYQPHAHLNYALNPRFSPQFDPRLLIRCGRGVGPKAGPRVLCLGGSTTFCDGVEEEAETWPRRLEERLRAETGAGWEVVNGGVSGYTTLDNLVHYVSLLTQVDPDLVVLYVGINDVGPRMRGDERLDYGQSFTPFRGDTRPPPRPVGWLRWSSAYGLYYLVAHVESLVLLGAGAEREPREAAEMEQALRRVGTRTFHTHLRNLLLLLRAQGKRILVVPQLWRARGPAEATTLRGVEEHNEVARGLCAELGVPFDDELLARQPETWDFCHFTARGCAEMADVVYQGLRRHHSDLLRRAE